MPGIFAARDNPVPVKITEGSVGQDVGQLAFAGVPVNAFKSKIAVSGGGSRTILAAAVNGKKIRILSLYYVCAGPNIVTLMSYDTTSVSDNGCSYDTNGGIVMPFNPAGWFDTVAGEALAIGLNDAPGVSGQVTWVAV